MKYYTTIKNNKQQTVVFNVGLTKIPLNLCDFNAKQEFILL